MAGRSPYGDTEPCEFHQSDGWLMVDALISILAGFATIVLVLFRHPFKLLGAFIVIGVIGTLIGWWTP